MSPQGSFGTDLYTKPKQCVRVCAFIQTTPSVEGRQMILLMATVYVNTRMEASGDFTKQVSCPFISLWAGLV